MSDSLFNENLAKASLTFKLLYKLHILQDIQKYGRISLFGFIGLVISDSLKRVLFTYSVKSYLLEPINKNRLRPGIWRILGCKVGKNVNIGHGVIPDFGNPDRITIGDNVVISNGVSILCHKRDVTKYYAGDNPRKLPFKVEDVVLEDSVQIGLNCTILPGVTIGKGSIIGSCSLVTKDIPAWSIAVGSPAKVVKQLPVILNIETGVSHNGGGKIIMMTSPQIYKILSLRVAS